MNYLFLNQFLTNPTRKVENKKISLLKTLFPSEGVIILHNVFYVMNVSLRKARSLLSWEVDCVLTRQVLGCLPCRTEHNSLTHFPGPGQAEKAALRFCSWPPTFQKLRRVAMVRP